MVSPPAPYSNGVAPAGTTEKETGTHLRITNGVLASEAISRLQQQMRALDEANRRVSTGVRVARPSDDPIAAAGIMQSSSGLRALEQYQRNLQTGQARLSLEDSALEQLTNVLMRAKELALSQAGDTSSASSRLAVKAEIDGIVDFVTDLGNTQFAGSYLFGGQYADTPPFKGGVLDPAKPPSGSQSIEVGAGQFRYVNHGAQEIFVDSDVVDSLRALSAGLAADDSAAIQAATSRIDSAFDTVQELVGDLGARVNQLDLAVANLDALDINLQTFRSGLADADLAEAVMDLVNRQGALQAAMLANSRMLNLTLADYL